MPDDTVMHFTRDHNYNSLISKFLIQATVYWTIIMKTTQAIYIWFEWSYDNNIIGSNDDIPYVVFTLIHNLDCLWSISCHDKQKFPTDQTAFSSKKKVWGHSI